MKKVDMFFYMSTFFLNYFTGLRSFILPSFFAFCQNTAGLLFIYKESRLILYNCLPLLYLLALSNRLPRRSSPRDSNQENVDSNSKNTFF